MFIDEEYIDDNVYELKDMIKNKTFKENECNNFMSYDSLEDEFSHNDIEEMQLIFMDKIKGYLSKEYPNKYAMWCDWCVHIATVDLYRDIMWSNGNYKKEYIECIENRDVIR